MVAIIAGKGVGLERSSAWVLGSQGQLGSAALGRGGDNVYVNAASGNLVISRQDEFLIGRGPDVSIDRTYNSQGDLSDDNGDNWRMGVYRKVTGLSGTYGGGGTTVKRIDWDGSDTLYTWNATQSAYVATDGAGAYDKLTRASGVWTWTDGTTQITETYDDTNGGRITARTDTDGNGLTYTYTGTRITRVTNSNGAYADDYTDLVYGGTGGNQLLKLETHAGGTLTRVYYTYDAYNRLSTVKVNLNPTDNSDTTGTNYTTTYTYTDTTNKRVASIAQSDGSLINIAYALSGSVYRVSSLTQTVAWGSTRTTTFTYQSDSTVVTDNIGQQTRLSFDANKNLTRIVHPADSSGDPRVIRFDYNWNGDVTKATLGPSNVITYTYDTGGNLLVEQDSAGDSVIRTYGTKNQVLTERRYALGYMTSGEYGTPMTTRYAYDAQLHLRFVVSPEGFVTEYQYETNPANLGYGQQIASIDYAANAYNVAGLASDATISESALISWAAGIGDKSTTRRTQTAYDYRGNISTVKSYSKLLTSGAFDTSSELSQTTYVYDQAGNLLSKLINGSSATETFIHDGLNRIVSSTDFNNITTTVAFNDASRTTVVSLANGLIKTSAYGQNGELLSSTESGTGVTSAVNYFYYDSLGRLRATADALWQPEIFFYDAIGQKTASVDSDGSLTEYRYDARGNLSASFTYATKLSEQWVYSLWDESEAYILDDFRPAIHADDRWTFYIYDGGQRLIQTIDGTGATTIYGYDGASRLVETRHYANHLTSIQMINLKYSILYPPNYTYGDSGWDWEISGASIDEAGMIEGHEAFEFTATTSPAYIKYADSLSSAAPALVTTSFYVQASGWATSHEFGFYREAQIEDGYEWWGDGDAIILSGPGTLTKLQGCLWRISGLSDDEATRIQMTTTTAGNYEDVQARIYISVHNPMQVQQYVNGDQIIIAGPTATLSTGGAVMPPTVDAANDRVTRSFYDKDNRLIGTLDTEGYLTQIFYDKAGQKKKTIAYSGATAVIQRQSGTFTELLNTVTIDNAKDIHTYCVYDARGFLRAEIDGEGNLTRYAYTPLGDLSEVVTGQKLDPAALLTTPPTFANLPAAASGTVLQTIAYTRNHYGQVLTETTSLTGSTTTLTTYAYDSGRRLVSTTTQAGGPDARTESRRYDKRGRLERELSGIGSALLAALGPNPDEELSEPIWTEYATLYGYDAADRLIARTSATGGRTLYYYDADDRLAFQVDGTGAVVEYRYDAFGGRTDTIVYAARFDTETFVEMTGGAAADIAGDVAALASLALDQRSTSVLDVLGRVRASRDPLGSVTLYDYNSFGDLVSTTVPLESGLAVPNIATPNFSFETPETGSGTTYNPTVSGIAFSTRSGVTGNGSTLNFAAAPDGDQVAFIQSNSGGTGSITMTVTGLNAGSSYQLSYMLAKSGSAASNGIYVWIDGNNYSYWMPGSTSFAPNNIGFQATSSTATIVFTGTQSSTEKRTALDKVIVTQVSSVPHSSFEFPEVGTGSVYNPSIYAASFQSKAGIAGNGSSWGFAAAPDGDQVAFLQSNSGGTGSISETLTNLIPGRSYQLSFYLAKRASANANPVTVSIDGNVLGTFTPSSTGFVQFTTSSFQVTGTSAVLTFSGAASATEQVSALDKVVLTQLASNNLRTSFTYDRRGLLKTQIVDSAAGGKAITTTYGYDAFGRAVQLTDPNSHITATAFDRAGRIKSTTDALAGVSTFTYDARDNLVAVQDALGQISRFVYDHGGRQIFAVDALGGVIATSYDGDDRVLSTRAYATAISLYGLGNQISATDVTSRLTTDAGDRITRHAYDKDGRRRFTVDGVGALTEYRYDDAGSATQTIRHGWTVSPASTYTMDDLQAQVDAHESDPKRVTRAVYDRAGKMTFAIDPVGNVTAFRYDSAGRMIEQVAFVASYSSGGDPLDEAMQGWAAANGHADDRVSRAVYDRKGRMVYSIDAEHFVTEYRYDKRNSLVKQIRYADPYTVPEGATPASLAAQIGSLPASAIVTNFVYDSAGRLAETVDGLSVRTVMTLDQRGQILSSTLAYGTSDAVTTSFQYDALGRLLTESRADGTPEEVTTAYVHNALGELVSITRAVGTAAAWTTTRSYDALGRLKREMSGIGSALLAALGPDPDPELADPIWAEYAVQFGYDMAGRMVVRSDEQSARTLFYYDTADRLAYEIDATGGIVEYRYNAIGDRTGAIRYAARIDGETLWEMVGGDAADIAGTVAALANASLDEASHFEFNLDGTIQRSTDPLDGQTTYVYNSFGEIILRSDPLNAGTVVQTSFDYDRRGQLASRIVDSAAGGKAITTTYGHDAFGRAITLTDANDHSTDTAYDRAGRVISTTDALNNTTSYTYDARGNLVAVKDALDHITRFVYDSADRRIFSVDALGGVTATSYDGDGRVLVTRAYANSILVGGFGLQITAGNVTAQLTTDAGDRITRHAYDKDGRRRFTVDGVGALTEYRYDDAGQAIRTIGYGWTVSPASTYTMDDLQAQVDAHANDPKRVTRAVYDRAGKMTFAIDPVGNVTAFRYDSAGRIIKQVAFVTAYLEGDDPLDDVMQGWPAANAHADDRVSRAVYDRKGRMVYSIDAESFVTEYRYNKNDSLVKEIRYADPYTVPEGATPASLAAQIGSLPASAIVTDFVYDSAGRLAETLDGLSVRTVMTLDQRGQILSSTLAYGTGDAVTTSFQYDALGRIESETRAQGTAEEQLTSYVHNALGELVSITRAVGTSAEWTTTRSYDALGRLKREMSGIGSALLAALGPDPDPELADPIWAEYAVQFGYDMAGRMVVRSDEQSARTLFYYDTADRLAYEIDATGGIVEYRYNAIGDRTDAIRYAARIDGETFFEMVGGDAADIAGIVTALANAPLDEVSHFEFNLDGTIQRSTDPLGGQTTYVYNSFGEIILRSDPLNAGTVVQTSFDYDRRGQVTTRIVDSAAGGKAITTSYGHDAFGREILLTNANDHSTDTVYDHAGRVESTTDALNNTTSFTYDARGNLVAVEDALNHITRFVYDSADRRIFSVDALGGVIATSYDGDDRVLATRAYANAISLFGLGLEIAAADVTVQLTTDAGDRITRHAYDKDGRLRFTVDGVGALTEYRYDDAGQAIRTIGYGWTVSPASTYTMDDLQAQVDAHENDPRRVTRAVYDRAGRMTFSIDPVGNVTAFSYDSAGRMIEQVAFVTAYLEGDDPLDDVMQGWPAANAHADDRVSRAVYDRKGRMVYSIDAESFVTEYRYNKNDSLVKEIRYADPYTVPEGATPASIAAQIGSLPASAIVTDFVYDSAGRLAETLDGLSVRTVMTLDQRGQILSSTLAYGTSDAVTTSFQYDALGRIESETRAQGTAEEQLTSYVHNALGELVSITRAVGTSAEWTTTRSYDALGRLKREMSGIGSALLAALGPNSDPEPIWAEYAIQFGYDTAGRMVRRSDAQGARTLFYYDTADRLAYEIDATGGIVEYRYNAIGDRTDAIRYAARINGGTLSAMAGGDAADIAGIVTALANASLDEKTTEIHDGAGRLSRSSGQLGSYAAYAYNSFGEVQLRKVALGESGTPGIATEIETSFIYDRRGKLEAQIVDSAAGGKAITTSYDHDAFGRAIMATDANDHSTDTSYDRAGRVESRTDALNNTTFFTYDARGNLVAVEDALNHITRYVYDKADRRIFAVDALGSVTATSYDGDGRVLATRAYADSILVGGFGLQITAGDVTAQLTTDAADRITRHAYDKDGRLRFTVDGAAGLTEYRYDDIGNATRTIRYGWTVSPASTYTIADLQAQVDAHANDPKRVTRAVYDLAGRMTFAIDATARVTALTYDSAGRVIKQIVFATAYSQGDDPHNDAMQSWAATHAHADDRVSRAVYDREGRLAYSVDAENFVTEYRYNRSGNVTEKIRYADPYSVTDGATPATMAALLPSSIPPSAVTTEYFYDSAGRLERTRDTMGTWTVMTLDQLGQVTETIVAHGTADAATTRRTYDALGRVESETRAYGAPEQAKTVYDYNARGDLETITYAHGTVDECVTTLTYDAAGRLESETRAAGEDEEVTTGYAYNAFGDMESTTAAAGTSDQQVTRRVFDSLGRLESETSAYGTADAATTSYLYNAFGNVVRLTDPRLNSAYFYYDGLDRLTLQVDPEGYVTETAYEIGDEPMSVTRYATKLSGPFDVAVRPTAATDPGDATTSFEYDKLGRLTDVTDAEDHGEHYELDLLGNRTQDVNKLDGVTDNVYDELGRLTTQYVHADVHDSSGTLVATVIQTDFDYDRRGNLKTKTEGVGLGADQRVTSYEYDKLDRLIEIDRPDINSVTVSPFMTAFTMEMKDSFTYDVRGNVIASQVAGAPKTYAYYDALGRKTDEVDEAGMLSHWSYDANGNVIAQKVYGDAVPFPGTRPAEAPNPVNANNFRETHFTYDRANRLETSFGAALTTARWDGDSYNFTTGAIVRHVEYDAAGNAIREYVGDVETRSFYDKLGRMIAQLDAENYLTVWERDAEGNVLEETRHATRVTGPIDQGASIEALHAAAGSSADDRITLFTYDRNGRRETETRLEVTASTTVAGVLATTQHVASQILYEYNGFGQVTRKLEANGDETLFTYDDFGRLTKTQAPAFAGHLGASVRPTTDNLFDAFGNVVRTALNDPNGPAADTRLTTYSYNRMGWLTAASQQISASQSNTHTYTYDAGGRIVWDQYGRTKSDGSDALDSITYTYDVSGRLLTQSVATRITTPPAVPEWSSGDVTRFKYNVYGDLTGRGINHDANFNPAYQETFDYDEGGRLWRSTEGGSGRIMFHDALGNATLTVSSTGTNVGALSFAAAKTSIENAPIAGDTNIADAVTTIGVFDKRSQQIATIEPDRQLISGSGTVTITSSRTYNAFGETTSETDARGHLPGANPVNFTTDFAYNTMGRLIRKESPQVSWTDANGTLANARPTEHYFYDVSGRMVAVTNANGHTTRRNLLAGTGHGGTEALVTVEYHADNNKAQLLYDVFGDARIRRNEYWIDGGTNDTAKTDVLMAYDKLGRLVEVQHLGRLLTETFTYDQLGQRTRHTMNALTETTDYDRQGRVTSHVAFGGDATTYLYAWDGELTTGALGNLGGWLKTTVNASTRDASEELDYFNRTIARSDFGDNAYSYTFDWGGRMTSMAGPGETLTYTYLNTNRISSISNGAGNSSAFGYDAAGNETSEITYRNSQLVQNATATWDALGRMSSWAEAGTTTLPAASIFYEYDRVGNIRRQKATFARLDGFGQPIGPPTQDNWYLYDNMNRVTRDRGFLGAIVNGELKTGDDVRGVGTIERQLPGILVSVNRVGEVGYDYAYDQTGRRMSMAMTKPQYTGAAPQIASYYEHKEMYDYFADGSLWKVRQVDGAATWGGGGQTLSVQPATGTGTLLSEFARDAFGRVTSQTDWSSPTLQGYSRTGVLYNGNGQITDEVVSTLAFEQNSGNVLYVNTIHNEYGAGANYALGAVVSSTSTVTRQGNAHSTATTTNTYDWREAPVNDQTTINTVRQVGGTTNYTTSYFYGASTDLTSVSIQDGRPRTVSFTNDMAGQVIRRDETNGQNGAPHEIWYRFGGKQMGHVSNNGTLEIDYAQSLVYRQIWLGDSEGLGAFRLGGNVPKTYADFSQSTTPINSYEQGGAGGGHVVRAGDTLQSIASMVWGNADLWYKLAEANGLSASSTLIEGQRLTIPAGVVSNAHNDGTFRPYDAAKALGDLSPSAAKPPAKPGGCGMLGQFLLLVIAIAVTAVVAPWATGIIAGTALPGSAAAIAAGVIGGAIGGAAGSIVSQTVGVVSGQQSKFDWKGVGLAAIGGAISGGLGALGKAAEAAALAGRTVGTVGKAALFLNGTGFVAGAARGVLTNSLTQGIGVATGLQKKFDWMGVATAGVGGGVAAEVGDWLDAGSLMTDPSLRNLGANFATSAASAVATAGVRSLVTGTSFGDNLIAALPEAIAVTVGNAIGGAINRRIARGAPAAAPAQRTAAEPPARNILVDGAPELGIPSLREYLRTHNPDGSLIRDPFDILGNELRYASDELQASITAVRMNIEEHRRLPTRVAVVQTGPNTFTSNEGVPQFTDDGDMPLYMWSQFDSTHDWAEAREKYIGGFGGPEGGPRAYATRVQSSARLAAIPYAEGGAYLRLVANQFAGIAFMFGRYTDLPNHLEVASILAAEAKQLRTDSYTMDYYMGVDPDPGVEPFRPPETTFERIGRNVNETFSDLGTILSPNLNTSFSERLDALGRTTGRAARFVAAPVISVSTGVAQLVDADIYGDPELARQGVTNIAIGGAEWFGARFVRVAPRGRSGPLRTTVAPRPIAVVPNPARYIAAAPTITRLERAAGTITTRVDAAAARTLPGVRAAPASATVQRASTSAVDSSLARLGSPGSYTTTVSQVDAVRAATEAAAPSALGAGVRSTLTPNAPRLVEIERFSVGIAPRVRPVPIGAYPGTTPTYITQIGTSVRGTPLSPIVRPTSSTVPKGSANPTTRAAASRGSTLHADRPGMLPDQLRAQYPDTEFSFAKPGVPGQDVRVVGGAHPSASGSSSWPDGVNFGDFKPGTPGGAKTFRSDQKHKWDDPTHYLPYDPVTGKLLPH